MSGERVKTVLIVTLMTVLVWLFAESRTLRTETLSLPVTILPGGPDTQFRLVGPAWNGVAELEFSGPIGQLDAMRSRLLEGIVLELGKELPSDPGVRKVDLRAALRRDEVIDQSGLTLRGVTPDSVEVEADRLSVFTIPVSVDTAGLATTGPVEANPQEITVRLPESIAAGVSLEAVARLDPAQLASLTPGRRAELTQVPVELLGIPPGAWGLAVDEKRVTVSLAVRARTESITLAELPLALEIPPSEVNAWAVEVPPEDRVVTEVVLTGPLAAIEQIRRGEVRPRAVAVLTPDMLVESGEVRVPVRIEGLPRGVAAGGEGREVRLTLTRRETGVGG